MANDAQFAPFLALNATHFAAAVGVATGVNVGVINGWVAFWTDFATTIRRCSSRVSPFKSLRTVRPSAMRLALRYKIRHQPTCRPPSLTMPDGTMSIEGDIANALLTIATGQYEVGIDCDLLPEHDPLQGEAGAIPVTELILTPLVTADGYGTGNGGDSPAGWHVHAAPAANPPLGTTNTLNAGDNLVTPMATPL